MKFSHRQETFTATWQPVAFESALHWHCVQLLQDGGSETSHKRASHTSCHRCMFVHCMPYRRHASYPLIWGYLQNTKVEFFQMQEKKTVMIITTRRSVSSLMLLWTHITRNVTWPRVQIVEIPNKICLQSTLFNVFYLCLFGSFSCVFHLVISKSVSSAMWPWYLYSCIDGLLYRDFLIVFLRYVTGLCWHITGGSYTCITSTFLTF